MTAVNLFIGGTGVNLAVFVKSYAEFYGLRRKPEVYAIDTDTGQQLVASRQLQNDLVLAYPNFLERLMRSAEEIQREPYDDLYSADRRSFGDAILHASGAVVKEHFQAAGGLFTLRAAGWLAFDDISQHNLLFIPNIVAALGRAKARAPQETPVLNVIGSVAGGTGSGLFIPLIAAIRANTSFPIEVNLHVVTPSAFHNNWLHDDEGPIKKSRGESGAYAAYREIMELSENAEKYSEPEERSVMRMTYKAPGRPHLIQKVYWWGRREGDANSRADDVFYEAGRFVTLLNDPSVYPMFVGSQGTANNRRIVGVATIEYPRLERARAIAAAGIEYLAKAIAHDSDPGARPSILAAADKDDIALLTFVRTQRASSLPLGSATVASGNRVDSTVVQSHLLDKFKVITDGEPTEALRSGIPAAGRGDAVRFPNYSGNDLEWRTYVGKLYEGLELAEQQTVRQMRKYLEWLREASISRIMEATAGYLDETRGINGQPSLPDARRALIDLVEDLDIARAYFERPIEDAVFRDPPISSVDSQGNEVLGLKERLTNLDSNNPEFKPLPPSGFWYHGFFRGAALVLTIAFLLMAFLRGAPVISAIYDWLAGQLLTRFGQELDARGLLIGAALSFLVFGVLTWLRSRNFKSEEQQRREAEEDLVRAWDELVLVQQLDLFWKSAAEICRNLVGSVPVEQVGQRREPTDGSLAQIFTLLKNGTNWLDELAESAGIRKKELKQDRPGWVRKVGDFTEPNAMQLRKVIPELRLRATVTPLAGVSQITNLDLVRVAADTGTNIPFNEWKRSEQRSKEEQAQHRVRLESFYLDIEQTALPMVSEQRLLAPDLRAALTEAGLVRMEGDQIRDVRGLAQWIDALIMIGKEQRSVGADLTRPLPQSPTPYLFAPGNSFAMVTEAMALMRRENFQYASYLPDRAVETDNIGQAVAFVQAATFGAENEADADVAKLHDIERTARETYYGVHHAPNGNPKVTKQYSARNTEFHLLPTLSAAARIETLAGRQRPVARAVSDRLYGSHHVVSGYPSILELYYLAKAGGHLESSEIAQGKSQPALWQWSLKHADGRVPLVQWPNFGAVPADDDFGKSRKEIALFDAFRVCMTKKATIGAPPQLTQPEKAEIMASAWADTRSAELIAAVRSELIATWQSLRGAVNAARRDKTYDEMRTLAEADAAGMKPQVGADWRLVTNAIFDHGRRDLSGSLSIEARAPDGVVSGPA